jgi:hypothetical protein
VTSVLFELIAERYERLLARHHLLSAVQQMGARSSPIPPSPSRRSNG